MENRFLGTDVFEMPPVGRRSALRAPRSMSRAKSNGMPASRYARVLTADQRALVVLIENGGIDLGIPELVDKLLQAVPASNLIAQSTRQQMIVALRDAISGLTDTLLESAELAVNRYSAAAPEHFGSVTVLRNSTASYEDLKNKLFSLSKEGKLIDLMILTHGSANEIAVNGGITGEKIKQMRAEFGKPLSIRSVYMMNCVGSSLNQAWIDTGAKVSSGSIRNNYLPEPTTFFFWQNWKRGQNFETAMTSAYRRTINLMNEAIRSFVRKLPIPGADLVASQIDIETMDFVRDSAPVIQGQRTVSISSDDLSFAQSLSSSLATTVLPVNYLRSMNRSAALSAAGVEVSHSFSYYSPSIVMGGPDDYSRMQHPGVIAGIAVADAIQIGLAAASIVQAGVQSPGGSFTLTYPQVQRLLTTEARNEMRGAQQKSRYRQQLMFIGGIRVGTAEANIVIEWEGNAYGEIGTPIIKRDLLNSTEWSRSSANITITNVARIPLPDSDPRAWPIVYHYEGSYDPLGNGHYEFEGEFEVNAFGGLKFNEHLVVSRSAIDFTLMGRPEDYVRKGRDNFVKPPEIPAEQLAFLRRTSERAVAETSRNICKWRCCICHQCFTNDMAVSRKWVWLAIISATVCLRVSCSKSANFTLKVTVKVTALR